MIFPLVPLIFQFGVKPQHVVVVQLFTAPRTHAHTDTHTVHAELAANGVVQRLYTEKSPTNYRRDARREKNDRFMFLHTSVGCGDSI